MIKPMKNGNYHVFVAKWIDGESVRRRKTLQCSRDEAKALERKFEDELEALKKSQGSLTSIKYIRDALIHYKMKGRKGVIPRKEESTYNRLLNDLGNNEIHLAYGVLQDFVSSQEELGDLAPASINRHIATLKSAINGCYKDRSGHEGQELIPKNYLHNFPKLDENNICYKILWNEQIDKFWFALNDSLKPLWYYSSCVPVREGEAINIQRHMVNIFSNTIEFPHGYTKNGEPRKIDIPAGMDKYLKSWYDSGADYFFNRGAAHNYAPHGYKDRDKDRIIFNFRKQWNEAATAAGVPDYNLHKTRQQAVMTLVAEGETYEDIMLFGGWLSAEAFEHYYDKETAFRLKRGMCHLDTTWKKRYANWFEGKEVPKYKPPKKSDEKNSKEEAEKEAI